MLQTELTGWYLQQSSNDFRRRLITTLLDIKWINLTLQRLFGISI